MGIMVYCVTMVMMATGCRCESALFASHLQAALDSSAKTQFIHSTKMNHKYN